LTEFIHIATAAASVASKAGWPAIIPQLNALKPLYLVDHAVAIGVFVLLYIAEAKQISKDPKAAAKQTSLAKRMFPVSLTSAKKALFGLVTGKQLTAATQNTAAGPGANNTHKFTTGDFARELERRNRGRAGSPSPGVSAGTTVLDRPTTPTKEDTPVIPSTSIIPEAPTKPAVKKPCTRRNKPSMPPTQAPTDRKESKREKELRERKAYLKNFWYVAANSDQLKVDKPLEVQILGRTVVLFRDEEGKPRCMENLCPHRGAPLGQGWVKEVEGHGKCVVCPYHAWAFDGEGRLSDVPSSTKGGLPKRPLLDTYPVEEKGGFVWLYFGSSEMPAEERPPIPYIPEMDDPNWRAVYAEMEFEAPHWNVFDNALDLAHIHYVHNGSFGNPDKPEVMGMAMERDTWGVKGNFQIHNKPVNKLWEWTRVPHVPVEVQAWLPMSSAVRITLGHGIQMITFVNTVPIDEHRSINRFCLIRNFATSPLMDGFVRKEMYKILGEDKVMVETVRPENMRQEFSLEVDLPQIGFRKLRQEWIDMGYGVDPKSTTGPSGTLDM